MQLAETQFAAVGLAQLLDLGMKPSTVRLYMKTGWLHRIHQGVYSLVPKALLSTYGQRMAAVLALGEEAGLSHLTALHHIKLRTGTPPREIDVSIPSRNGRARQGIRIHRSLTLRPEDLTEIYGINCTTVARTLVDCCALLSSHDLEAALTQAARESLLDLEELKEQLHRARRRPATRKLKRILATYDEALRLTESELEARFLKLIRQAGLPEPELQVWIDLGDGEPKIRADFYWRNARLIVETDGSSWHDPETDKRRDQRTAAAGLTTIRVTRRQIIAEPARIRRTVVQAYAAGVAATAASAASAA